jgi:transcriptional regulator with XRE-family HTH domain
MAEPRYISLLPDLQGPPFWIVLNGASLQLLRQALAINREDLAHLLQIGETTLKKLEEGSKKHPSAALTARIEKLLQIKALSTDHSGACLIEFTPRSLQLLRRGHSMTRAELARRSGLSPEYIKRLERGERQQPSLDLLACLGECLGVQFFLLQKGY